LGRWAERSGEPASAVVGLLGHLEAEGDGHHDRRAGRVCTWRPQALRTLTSFLRAFATSRPSSSSMSNFNETTLPSTFHVRPSSNSTL
jgi:hypothetical protein